MKSFVTHSREADADAEVTAIHPHDMGLGLSREQENGRFASLTSELLVIFLSVLRDVVMAQWVSRKGWPKPGCLWGAREQVRWDPCKQQPLKQDPRTQGKG